MPTVRTKTACPSYRLDDDTTRLAVRSVGTRSSWTSTQIFAWWTYAFVGSSRQVHQVDRSNTSHQPDRHHGRQILQGHHLSLRRATQHPYRQRQQLCFQRISRLLRSVRHQTQLCIGSSPTDQWSGGEDQRLNLPRHQEKVKKSNRRMGRRTPLCSVESTHHTK